MTFFLLRDIFESLKCWLDHWLNSLLDCINFCVFLFFEKLVLSNPDNFSIPLNNWSIYQALWSSFYRILDSFSIHRETFCLLDRCSIVVWSIEVGFYSTIARQLLDLLRSSCMHCFSHVLHLSVILSSIASCLITFMHLFGFFVPPCSSLCFLGETF